MWGCTQTWRAAGRADLEEARAETVRARREHWPQHKVGQHGDKVQARLLRQPPRLPLSHRLRSQPNDVLITRFVCQSEPPHVSEHGPRAHGAPAQSRTWAARPGLPALTGAAPASPALARVAGPNINLSLYKRFAHACFNEPLDVPKPAPRVQSTGPSTWCAHVLQNRPSGRVQLGA